MHSSTSDHAGGEADGGAGNDTISQVDGGDTVTSGTGSDHIVLQYLNGGGTTEITDFDPTVDKLDVTALGAFNSALQSTATQSGGNTTVYAGGDTIQIDGVTVTDLFSATYAAITGAIGGTTGNNLVGNSGDNTISSSSADIYGHYATSNNDTLTGNGGVDYLYGGAGNDLYVFHEDGGQQEIIDGESDTNVLRMVGVTQSEFYMGSYGPNNSIIISSYSGSTFQGLAQVFNLLSQTSGGEEIRYIQLDDATFDTQAGMLWRGWQYNTGETIQTLSYETANDTVQAGGGGDVVYSYGGNDSIDGGTGNDTLYGGDGNDVITGGADNDVVFGGNGNDTLYSGGGTDYLYGEAGNDTFVFHEDGGQMEITDNETDTNTLRMEGVTQSEFYLGSYSPNNSIIISSYSGSTSQGLAQVFNMLTQTSGGEEIRYIQLDDITYDTQAGMLWRGWQYNTGETIQTLSYETANDTVQAGGGNDVVYSYGGNDSIDGGTGNDTLYGGAGNDTITGGTGNDYLYGSDTANGASGNDTFVFHAGDGEDVIYASEATTNTLVLPGVSSANFYMTASSHWNYLYGYIYDNSGTYQGDAAVAGEPTIGTGLEIGTVVLDDATYNLSTGAVYRLKGAGPDSYTLEALQNTGNDTLIGDGYSDNIYGYDGNDSIDGGGGSDNLYGGAGNDTYVFHTGYGHNVINDTSGSNTLQIGAYDHYTDSGGNRTYYLDTTNTDYVTIIGYTAHASDWAIA